MITRLFRERQLGDYEFDLSIGEDEAKEDIQSAERIVDAITNYLVKGEFIESEGDYLISNEQLVNESGKA